LQSDCSKPPRPCSFQGTNRQLAHVFDFLDKPELDKFETIVDTILRGFSVKLHNINGREHDFDLTHKHTSVRQYYSLWWDASRGKRYDIGTHLVVLLQWISQSPHIWCSYSGWTHGIGFAGMRAWECRRPESQTLEVGDGPKRRANTCRRMLSPYSVGWPMNVYHSYTVRCLSPFAPHSSPTSPLTPRIQLMGSLLGHEKTLEVFSVLLHVRDRSLPNFFGPDLVLCLVDFLVFVVTGHILSQCSFCRWQRLTVSIWCHMSLR
jgi:hypothetical protein